MKTTKTLSLKSKTKISLDDKLKEANKQAEKAAKLAQSIKDKIEKQKAKNKPKSIMDRVKTMSDVLRIAKLTKEELALYNYSGKSKRLIFARDFMTLALIAEVLNEGVTPKVDGKDERHYPYYWLSSGFVFAHAGYAASPASASSASRLAFNTEALAEYAGKQFLPQYQRAICNI